MKDCIIVGQPNSGKTLFALQFAYYSGMKKIDLVTRRADETMTCRQYAFSEARSTLCSSTYHKTRHIQSFILTLPVKKGKLSFRLQDTCGLIDTIHPDENLRLGMAQTLSAMESADLILHLVDCYNWYDYPSLIDQELYQYGLYRSSYLILANKIDLSGAAQKIKKIQEYFDKVTVLPISALKCQGFQEVKARVTAALS